MVELSVEAFGSFEESFFDLTIDFAGKDVSIKSRGGNSIKKKIIYFIFDDFPFSVEASIICEAN